MSIGALLALSARSVEPAPRVATGLVGVDGLLDSLRPRLLVVTGPPRVGRSMLAWQAARCTHGLGVPVQLVSAREDTEEVAVALMSGESGVPRHHLQDGRVSSADESLAAARRSLAAGGPTVAGATSEGPPPGPHDTLGASGCGLLVLDDVDLWDANWLDHLSWYRAWAKGNAAVVLVTIAEQPIGSRVTAADALTRHADVVLRLAVEPADPASAADVLHVTVHGPDGTALGMIRAQRHGHVCRLMDATGHPALRSG